MINQEPSLFDKFVYIVISAFLLSLAYAEALKSISLVLMLALFVYALLSDKASISRDGINTAIVLHMVFVIMGVWVGINPEESLKQFSDVLKILLVFLFFREIDLKFLNIEKILKPLIYGFIFALIVGMYLYYFQGMDFVKLRSVGSINRSAVYMVLILMLLLPFAYRDEAPNIFWKLAVGLTVVGIVSASSRMAMFSLPLLFLCFVYLKDSLRIKHILLVVLSVVFVAIVPELFPGTRLASRFNQGFDDPARMQLWEASIKYFFDSNPLLGIGVGNNMFIDLKTYYGPNAHYATLDNTHQLYLDMLVERGILGLTTFAVFIGLIMKNSHNNLKQHPIYISVFLMSFAVLLMGLANITFRYEFGLLFVVAAGLSLNKSLKLNSRL